MADWLAKIKSAKKSAIIQNNLKKVHYLFTDGKELVEEYNTDLQILSRRAWKVKTELGSEGIWDIELGDPEPRSFNTESQHIQESSTEPIVTRRSTKVNLEWRIRNLPYPVEVYSVVIDSDLNGLIIKTSNKKYYKKIDVPELVRANISGKQANISFIHKFNTLIITYKKPQEVLELEKAVYEEAMKVPVKSDGDINNCNPS